MFLLIHTGVPKPVIKGTGRSSNVIFMGERVIKSIREHFFTLSVGRKGQKSLLY